MIQIRIRHQWIFTDNIHGLYFTIICHGHHFGHGQPDFVRQPGNPPGRFHSFPDRLIGNRLVSRKNIGQSAHVTGALHVVLTTKRIHTTAGNPEIAAQHRQIGQ